MVIGANHQYQPWSKSYCPVRSGRGVKGIGGNGTLLISEVHLYNISSVHLVQCSTVLSRNVTSRDIGVFRELVLLQPPRQISSPPWLGGGCSYTPWCVGAAASAVMLLIKLQWHMVKRSSMRQKINAPKLKDHAPEISLRILTAFPLGAVLPSVACPWTENSD